MSLDRPFPNHAILLVPLNECHESLTATTCIMNKFLELLLVCRVGTSHCSGGRYTSCGLKQPCCTLKYFRKWLLSYSFNGAAQHLVHRYFRWAWVSLIPGHFFCLDCKWPHHRKSDVKYLFSQKMDRTEGVVTCDNQLLYSSLP